MPSSATASAPIEEALAELRAGRMIVLVDDEHRENEGDLVIAAEKVTPEAINFMMRNACGIVCLAMSPADLRPAAPGADGRRQRSTRRPRRSRRRSTPAPASPPAPRPSTAPAPSQVAIDDRSTPADLVRGKGHVDGLRAREGGVLVRAGHTEGSVDLARLAGFKEAAVICEIVNPDGTMARLPDLREFCQQHGLKMCTIEDLIKYRRQRERLIRRELSAQAADRASASST